MSTSPRFTSEQVDPSTWVILLDGKPIGSSVVGSAAFAAVIGWLQTAEERLIAPTGPTEADAQLAGIKALIDKHGKEVGRPYGMTVAGGVEAILTHYSRAAAERVAAGRAFRDDVITQLRAMSLVVDMTGSAHTHREKEARLRGMSDLIESAIAKLRAVQFDSLTSYWQWPDVFRSDYATRRLLGEIHDLRQRLAAYEPQPDAPAVADDGMPF